MKHKIILFTILNLIILIIFGVLTYQCTSNHEQMVLNVYFGESHAGKNNIAQLFYSENSKKFKGNKVITVIFRNNSKA